MDKVYVQFVARIILSLLLNMSFFLYANSVEHFLNCWTKRILTLITLTQFHFIFYSSRPLPNTFALILVLTALSKWLSKNWNSFIAIVAITVVIFRSETSILFGFIIISEVFINKSLSIKRLILVGIPCGLLALSSTILFDSLIWNEWTWPEGYGLYFNIYLNKSKDWGTQPFLWYFYSALPRSLLFSIFFVPFCDKKCLYSIGVPAFLFILLYSCLPHKELRFIIYTVPMLNTCAANTIANILHRYLYRTKVSEEESKKLKKYQDETKLVQEPIKLRLRKRSKNVLGKEVLENVLKGSSKKKETGKDITKKWTVYNLFLISLVIVGCLANIGLTLLACLSSSQNYPGGDAIIWLNSRIRSSRVKAQVQKNVLVHVSNLAAQTGFTRFLEMENVTYDKSPDFKSIPNQLQSKYKSFYFILENIDQQFIRKYCGSNATEMSNERITCNFNEFAKNCKIVNTINGFKRFQFSLNFNQLIKSAPVLWIFECNRKNFNLSQNI